MKWVDAYVAKSEIEATMIKHKLEDDDIPCQLFNITTSRMFAEINEKHLSGIEVRVPEKFLSRSKNIIKGRYPY